MQTLNKGFKKPQPGDNGSIFYAALEQDIQQVNDHTHNGTNSQLLNTAATVALTTSVPSGSWVATSGGTYRQLVTIPISISSIDTVMISMKETSTGNIYYLTTEKVSGTTYYVYTNNNTKSFTAVYTS